MLDWATVFFPRPYVEQRRGTSLGCWLLVGGHNPRLLVGGHSGGLGWHPRDPLGFTLDALGAHPAHAHWFLATPSTAEHVPVAHLGGPWLA